MNKIELTGRLTRDPDLRYTPNNRPVAQFTIAVNRRYAKETDEIKADFFPIVVWGKQGENCKTYLLKGSMVGIIGTLRNRSYEKDGNTRYITEVIAEEVEFLTPKKQLIIQITKLYQEKNILHMIIKRSKRQYMIMNFN